MSLLMFSRLTVSLLYLLAKLMPRLPRDTPAPAAFLAGGVPADIMSYVVVTTATQPDCPAEQIFRIKLLSNANYVTFGCLCELQITEVEQRRHIQVTFLTLTTLLTYI